MFTLTQTRIQGRRMQSRGTVRSLLAVVALAVMSAGAVVAQTAPPPDAANTFNDSGNGSQGLIGVNQNTGDFNNQANIASIAFTGEGNSAALAKVIADAEQSDNTAFDSQVVQTNGIKDAFNQFSGIAQLNQTTGQANNQINIVAIAFAPGATFSPALTDVELSGVTSPVNGRTQSSASPDSTNTIEGSFNNFQGLAQVQQIAGDGNVVVNVVAIAVGGGG
ncbi:MAG: hypothetical protein JSR86_04170 [Proteobacteria bacterium]|nr:hypothetical protein [Pseudomonadota bacterium]